MLVINFQHFPTLHTPRLHLREIGRQDIQPLYYLRSNPALMRYIGKPLAQNEADAVTLLEKMQDSYTQNEGITWAICIKDAPEMIGFIGFWRMQKENYRAEIGYMLHDKYHRQGILYEAMQVALKYAFEDLGFHSIEAHIDPENVASERLLEKAGFAKEAHFRENFYFEGQFLDTLVYGKLQMPLPTTRAGKGVMLHRAFGKR